MRREEPPLTMRGIWLFFWPLALSSVIMYFTGPAVQAGLARTVDPELSLAAFNVALSGNMFVTAPVSLFLVTATALVRDEKSYRLTRNLMLAICAAVTLLSAGIALHQPLYDLVYVKLLGFPPAVTAIGRGALLVLVPSAILVGVRRYYQGIMARFGETKVVSIGSAARLAVTAAVMAVGVVAMPTHGALIGGTAIIAGIFADTVIALIYARRLLMQGVLAGDAAEAPRAGSGALRFLAFFAPLAAMSLLRMASRPLMLSGIARSGDAVLTLAAFPVALSTLQMISEPTLMIQQVTVAQIRNPQSAALVRRFALIVVGVCAGLAVLVAFTPLAGLYHGLVIGLRGDVLARANSSVQLLVPVAGMLALQSYLQGLLIHRGLTAAVNLAAIANIFVLVGGIYGLALSTSWPGHVIAGVVYAAALLVALALLGYWLGPRRARGR